VNVSPKDITTPLKDHSTLSITSHLCEINNRSGIRNLVEASVRKFLRNF
jgi:hypothetical protein